MKLTLFHVLALVAGSRARGDEDSSINVKVHKADGGVGQQNLQREARGIVNGEEAVPGQFPYFVDLTGVLRCGGSMIWKDIILTAAHCDHIAPGTLARIGTTTNDFEVSACLCLFILFLGGFLA